MKNKDCRMEIRLSEKEKKILERKCKKAKLTYSELIRRLIMNCKIAEAPPADYYELICEVRRTGANINQLLKVANSIGILDVPKIRTALEDNRKTEQMLWNTFAPEKA